MTAPALAKQVGDERFYNVDGVDLPSVSTVKSVVAAKAIETWKQKRIAAALAADPELLAMAADERTLYQATRLALESGNDAADFGTAVHAAVEFFEQTGEIVAVDVVDDNIADRVERCVRNYVSLKHEVDFETVQVERTVANMTVGYAGTLDQMIRIGPALMIGDVKTGSRKAIKEKIGGFAYQLAAYANAEGWVTETGTLQPFTDDERPIAHRGAIIWLDPDFAELWLVELSEAWHALRAQRVLWMAEQGKGAWATEAWRVDQ
jgi:hypothetical protein